MHVYRIAYRTWHYDRLNGARCDWFLDDPVGILVRASDGKEAADKLRKQKGARVEIHTIEHLCKIDLD